LKNEQNLPFENVIFAGILKCCGMEDRTVVAHACWNTKKLLKTIDWNVENSKKLLNFLSIDT